MSPELGLFAKSCSSLEGQRLALAALRGRSLKDRLTPVGAVGFGAVPIAEIEGSLVLATVPAVCPGYRQALSSALGAPAVPLPFEEGLVREAIDRFYLRDRRGEDGLDLPTFQTPEFLLKPELTGRLIEEKKGKLPPKPVSVPEGGVALLELRVHNVLRPLDGPVPLVFASGPSEPGFGIRGEEAVLFRDRLPDASKGALVSQSVLYDGCQHLQALTYHELDGLPHVIHPSELQLAEITDRTAVFWVYDSFETVEAHARAHAREPWTRSRRYYFLRFGARFERTFSLDVLHFCLVKHSALRLARRGDFGPAELGRVLGLDFPVRHSAAR